MTNYLTPENMKIYLEHLKKVDEKVEKQIQKELKMSKEWKKKQRLRKYLRNLVLPEWPGEEQFNWFVRDAKQLYVNSVKVHLMNQNPTDVTNVNVGVKEEIIQKKLHYVKTAKKQGGH